ncbi:MAG: hypothetical protein PHW24_00785 [Candidatus Moranbacteria bacterium]|nr:hypothetical protein [Candidatus Moranbacteria bacterium]
MATGAILWVISVLFFPFASTQSMVGVVMVFNVIGVVMFLSQNANDSAKYACIELSKEVNLRYVPVVGYRSFKAQILIEYNNGQLDKVSLVEKTTITHSY